MNLMNNARDALIGVEQPSIKVALHRFNADTGFLKKHPDAKPGEYAVISVQDNGCGIPADKIDTIFEPFYTTKETGAGTGLGLAMIYGAVQAHNGIIDVKSQMRAGTMFSIYLQLSEEDKHAITSGAKQTTGR